MHKRYYLLLLLALGYSWSGCSMGLRWGQMGRHFKSSMPDSTAVLKTEKVAVCAFSNGALIPVTSVGSDVGTATDMGFFILTRIIPGAWLFPPPSYQSKGLRYQLFPDEIEAQMEIHSDSSTAKLSSHICDIVCDSLRRRGYSAIAFKPPPSDTVRLEELLANAQKSDYDAVFVVYYSLVTGWLAVEGYDHVNIPEHTAYDRNGHVFTVAKEEYDVEILGAQAKYAILPNAALIRLSDKKILWSTCYYGLVKNASIPNPSQESLNFVVSAPVLQYSDNRVLGAGSKAMTIIFNPPNWRDSYIPLPRKH